jgi:hypothetical protein
MGANLIYHDDKIEAHDRQIEALIRLAREHREEMKALDKRIADLVRAAIETRKATQDLWRQWQAYINTLPRQ